MQINFYNCTDDKKKLSKKLTFVNSRNCNLYGTCSFDNPNFLLNSKASGNYVSWDNRLYFVTEQTYNNGKYIVHCAIDDLTTNRNKLKKCSVLVSRSEERNRNIVDSSIVLRKNDYVKTDTFGKRLVAYNAQSYVIGVI